MEHLWGLSRQAVRHFTGIDPVVKRPLVNEAFRRLAEVFEVDLIWGGGLPGPDSEVFNWDDGETVKRNRAGKEVVQWGIFGTVHQEDGRHFTHIPKPANVDEALAFEPLQHFHDSIEQYRLRFQQQYAAMLENTGDTALPVPHHYTTCFHWPLAILGFELLCEAGSEEDRFARLMERFAEISRRITAAWAGIPGLHAFILHDDLTMTSGPVFPPDWYRRHVFVHYRGIFEPLQRAGIPIIFTSDGDCSIFVDDIFRAGADGLNMEYLVDLGDVARRYPDKILIGNINAAILANGPRSAIEAEVRRCIEAGKTARRFVANVGGQLTHTIPIEHLEWYLNVRRQLCRTARL
jgi:hypothetical protein